jgi:hypothetical protein
MIFILLGHKYDERKERMNQSKQSEKLQTLPTEDMGGSK